MFICYHADMVRNLFIVALLLLLTSCSSGMSLYVSDEETAHYRTFARITSADDSEKTYFKVKKRNRQIMAEKELYNNNKGTSISFAGGKHKDKNWSSGFILRYTY